MSKRRLIDTNLIVRYLVQDHPRHAQAANKLFAACDQGEITLVLLPAVLAEAVFVLESFYKKQRIDIAAALKLLLGSPGIEIPEPIVHADALDRYSKTKVHFVDCLIAAHAAVSKLPIATFDSDFKKFPDVTVAINVD